MKYWKGFKVCNNIKQNKSKINKESMMEKKLVKAQFYFNVLDSDHALISGCKRLYRLLTNFENCKPYFFLWINCIKNISIKLWLNYVKIVPVSFPNEPLNVIFSWNYYAQSLWLIKSNEEVIEDPQALQFQLQTDCPLPLTNRFKPRGSESF